MEVASFGHDVGGAADLEIDPLVARMAATPVLDAGAARFVGGRGGQLDLYRSQIGTTSIVKLAPFGRGQTQGIIRRLGFSGNGADIWFAAGSLAPTRIIPQTSADGVSRPFLGEGAQAPAWSRADDRLVYFDNTLNDTLMIADRIGADAKPIPIAPSDQEDWSGGEGTIRGFSSVNLLIVDEAAREGQIVSVRIEGASQNSLTGERVAQEAA